MDRRKNKKCESFKMLKSVHMPHRKELTLLQLNYNTWDNI